MSGGSRRRTPLHLRWPNEFYWWWIIATAAYGVGDIVTTIAMVFFTPALAEGNPLVRWAIDSYGLGGLVGIKLGGFFIMIWISWLGSKENDRLLYYFPPVLLTIVGLFLTAYNLRLLVLAW